MLERTARRAVFAAVAAFAVGASASCASDQEASPSSEAEEQPDRGQYEAEFERLQEEYDARLGVYALDTGSDTAVTHRPDERFAYASTFKPLACGAVLEQRSLEEMEEVVHYDAEDLVEYSPITEEHVDEGMTLVEVCDAAIRYSDNTAGNLLFRELGGPEGLQEALEGLGDKVTQVDRIETDLNEAKPGDSRDTTTTEAFAANLREYVIGDTLPEEERDLLREMLVENTTGDDVIRAGVPEDWEVGDKTGSPGYGGRNDIAIAWPPDGEPVILSIMSSRDEKDAERDDALIAEAAEVAVDALR
ncbi:beta-lactamase class A [Lipingzhangella halophila]|uniref:Beta-lactamase n=1 Tax=Lipingzhangella halophila TaxID=1783352 RepID=A0A7W7RGA1_9ACTN|nr:class A beta-lactamase [Lipingzhangella halophila]MBB4931449.1 beta-lactamase class A [Lipingzhangella halophila]